MHLYQPAVACATPCRVVLLGPGYGVGHLDYGDFAGALARLGYLVVAVRHQLETNPPLPSGPNVFALRSPSWRQGAANLRFVRDALARRYPDNDWAHVVLMGHSHGGDVAAWAAREGFAGLDTLVTLDNRRVPLPRDGRVRVLSIRGVDFPADDGVLPSWDEQARSGACIVTVPGARHDAMSDAGDAATKQRVIASLVAFLRDGTCAR